MYEEARELWGGGGKHTLESKKMNWRDLMYKAQRRAYSLVHRSCSLAMAARSSCTKSMHFPRGFVD